MASASQCSTEQKNKSSIGNFPNGSYQRIDCQTRFPSSPFSLEFDEILHSPNSAYSIRLCGLPETVSITVWLTVTVIVPGQEKVGGWGLHLPLAQAVFVAFPVKVPHVSHVQSRGRGDMLDVRQEAGGQYRAWDGPMSILTSVSEMQQWQWWC